MQVTWWAPLVIVGFAVGAIVFNLVVWKVVLRLFEAVGARWSPNLFICVRQLAGPKSGFLSVIGLLSILGVSFASCTLDTVLSVMGGFQEDLKHKIVGSNAHVVIDRPHGEGISEYAELLERVRAVPGVVGATPLVLGEALVQSPRTQNLAGAIVRGIDLPSVGSATDLERTLTNGARLSDLEDPLRTFRAPSPQRPRTLLPGASNGAGPYIHDADASAEGPADATAPVQPGPPPSFHSFPPGLGPLALLGKSGRHPQRTPPGIFIGAQLAEMMNLQVGDEIQLVAPMGDLGPTGPMPKSRPFLVAGIFHSGMYEYDTKYVYIAIREAQKFFRMDDVASQIAVRVRDLDRATPVAEDLRRVLPQGLRVQDWQAINKGLFAALKLEKVIMFLILLLAILVASFSIVSTLALMVFEKHKQIAVLKALGTPDPAVRRIFQLQGILIGTAGAITGSVLAVTLCLLVRHVIPFPVPEEVFYISRMPVAMSPVEFLVVGVAAVAIAILSTTYPSRIAARLRPADGLRFE